jgi:hypothetical protein
MSGDGKDVAVEKVGEADAADLKGKRKAEVCFVVSFSFLCRGWHLFVTCFSYMLCWRQKVNCSCFYVVKDAEKDPKKQKKAEENGDNDEEDAVEDENGEEEADGEDEVGEGEDDLEEEAEG